MPVFQPKYKDAKTGAEKTAHTWWCDFRYKGRRIRESTGQTKKTLAKLYEDRRRRELQEAVAGVKPATSEERIQNLKTVITHWTTVRTAGKKAKTVAFIRERCAHLIEHFGSMLAGDVTQTKVAEYITKREKEGAVANSINREVFMLSRALRVDRATAWPDLGRSKKWTKKAGKAIDESEQEAILKAAAANRSRVCPALYRCGHVHGFPCE